MKKCIMSLLVFATIGIVGFTTGEQASANQLDTHVSTTEPTLFEETSTNHYTTENIVERTQDENGITLVMDDGTSLDLPGYTDNINEVGVDLLITTVPSRLRAGGAINFPATAYASGTISNYNAYPQSTLSVYTKVRKAYQNKIYEATYRGNAPRIRSVQSTGGAWIHEYGGYVPYVSHVQV